MASGKKRTRGNSGARVNRPLPAAVDAPVVTTRAAQPNIVKSTVVKPTVFKPTVQNAPAPASSSLETPTRRTDAVDWDNEYRYVVGDLKQMAMVTVGLFAVMIAIGLML